MHGGLEISEHIHLDTVEPITWQTEGGARVVSRTAGCSSSCHNSLHCRSEAFNLAYILEWIARECIYIYICVCSRVSPVQTNDYKMDSVDSKNLSLRIEFYRMKLWYYLPGLLSFAMNSSAFCVKIWIIKFYVDLLMFIRTKCLTVFHFSNHMGF